ncbi:hypothetical protein BOO25_20080 [Vibrio navarrensis]|uniref:hypothetical protein n=1 Tax=Vibrio navarrensis TaxID=29495 RepID=UPI00192F6C04|nr:hypothetical protein [Vibrio navarrensis]MBE3671228.1 hypothetical protein [Vibrio navarrensis]
MKRTQFKMKKKHALKAAPLMMSLLLMACGGEDSGLPSQPGLTDPCAPTSYTCDSDKDGYMNGEDPEPNNPNVPVMRGDEDDDRDGLTNGWEEKNKDNGADPNDPDKPVQGGNKDDDGDGIPNGKETVEEWDDNDPNNPVPGGDKDDDKDGIPNGKETVEEWDDNDPNNPVPGGDKDDDKDGIKNGKETVEGWDDNDPNNPVQGGNLDSDHDGLKDGFEEVSGSDKNDPNDPVQDGDKDKDGDGIKNGLETVEGWDDNDANNPTQGGNEDKDGDGIKNGRETVEGWDDNDADIPVENGDQDSDGDGLKDGREYAEGWDKLDPNDPVANGDEDKDGDGFPNGLETIEGWDDNDASNPISPEKVQNPDLVLDNSAVVPGTTLQAVIEFGLEGSTQTYSTLNVADADHVTWSVLDGSQNPVTELVPTSEGLVTIPAMEEIISLVNQPLTMRATFVYGGWFSGQAPQDEAFEVTISSISEIDIFLTDSNGNAMQNSLNTMDHPIASGTIHLQDGNNVQITEGLGVGMWSLSSNATDIGITIDSVTGELDFSLIDESALPAEGIDFTVKWLGSGAFAGSNGEATVSLGDTDTIHGAVCGGAIGVSYPIDPTSSCLALASTQIGDDEVWITSPISKGFTDRFGFVEAKGDVDVNNGLTYADKDSGYGGYPGFTHDTLNGRGQDDRACDLLSEINFAGRDEWHVTTAAEIGHRSTSLNPGQTGILLETDLHALWSLANNVWINIGENGYGVYMNGSTSHQGGGWTAPYARTCASRG